ncbi:MAG: hypothetical protein ACYTEL_18315 [Planctomycetota bacterium]
MRQLCQAQGILDIAVLLQDADDTPIVGFEELPKHEYGEDLSLGEIVSTA